MSGLVVALALIPEAIAFSIIAGVDPKVGLYASFCIAVVIAFVGGRPGMISAATGAMALLMVTLVKQHGLEYLLAATLLTGVLQIGAGYLKLGGLMRFVSKSVVTGFVNALAGSAGDNEQRVGRVDRMYGSLNRRLGTGDGTLKILYPYLAASIDEDQVASFIRRKRDVENQLDKCLQDQADDVVHQEETASWQHLLHKPIRKGANASKPHDAVDPYPATFDNLLRDSAVSEQKAEYTYTRHDITSQLETLLTKASAANLQATDEKSEWLFKLERQLPATYDTKERYQPIFVKLDFSAAFSAVVPDTAYIVRLASPIASRDTLQQVANKNWPKIVKELTQHYPLVRAVLNNEAQNSHFYLSAVCELPLFANDRKLGLLSQAEITLCLQQLEAFADALEHALFNGKQDLRMEHVLTGTSVRGSGEDSIQSRTADFSQAEWRKHSLTSGDVEIIQAVVDLETLKGMLGKHKPAMAHIAMHCNSLFPFINFVAGDTAGDTGKVTAQIAFPSVDFNEEERGVLKAWFNIIC